MGHKVNPIGLRLGINRTWDSRWFAQRGEYAKLLHEDMAIRKSLESDEVTRWFGPQRGDPRGVLGCTGREFPRVAQRGRVVGANGVARGALHVDLHRPARVRRERRGEPRVAFVLRAHSSLPSVVHSRATRAATTTGTRPRWSSA